MLSKLWGPGRRPVLISTQEHDFGFRPSNTKRMRTALVFNIMLMFTLAVCAGDNVIKNPGFEEGFSGQGVATGWSDQSSWAPVKVKYSEDRYNPHSGRSAQRIDVTEFKGGAVQFQTSTALEKGKPHTVSVWLRAKESMQVDVQLRKKGLNNHVERRRTGDLHGTGIRHEGDRRLWESNRPEVRSADSRRYAAPAGMRPFDAAHDPNVELDQIRIAPVRDAADVERGLGGQGAQQPLRPSTSRRVWVGSKGGSEKCLMRIGQASSSEAFVAILACWLFTSAGLAEEPFLRAETEERKLETATVTRTRFSLPEKCPGEVTHLQEMGAVRLIGTSGVMMYATDGAGRLLFSHELPGKSMSAGIQVGDAFFAYREGCGPAARLLSFDTQGKAISELQMESHNVAYLCPDGSRAYMFTQDRDASVIMGPRIGDPRSGKIIKEHLLRWAGGMDWEHISLTEDNGLVGVLREGKERTFAKLGPDGEFLWQRPSEHSIPIARQDGNRWVTRVRESGGKPDHFAIRDEKGLEIGGFDDLGNIRCEALKDGKHLLVIRAQGLDLYRWEDGQRLWTLADPHRDIVFAQVSPDGHRLALLMQKDRKPPMVSFTLVVLDMKTGRELFHAGLPFEAKCEYSYAPNGMRWVDRGDTLRWFHGPSVFSVRMEPSKQ